MTSEDILEFLNELTEHDARFMQALVQARHVCNEQIQHHPTVQCGFNQDGEAVAGIVGVLNGYLGSIDEDLIAAAFDASGTLTGFMLAPEV